MADKTFGNYPITFLLITMIFLCFSVLPGQDRPEPMEITDPELTEEISSILKDFEEWAK